MRIHTLLLVLPALVLSVATALAQEAPTGPSIFQAQGCQACHAVPGASLAKLGDDTLSGPDLQGLGEEYRARNLKRWLKRDKLHHGHTHLQRFQGTDEELKVLVDWLVTL